ncbi:MAG TPA: PEGA domain-containing protein [Methanoregulaceae archaeon]|nr:PEGA domain-containing protein [Methanoregulaceae archaeon]
MRFPSVIISLIFILAVLVPAGTPVAGPSVSPESTLNVSHVLPPNGPFVPTLPATQTFRHPYGEVVFPITGPLGQTPTPLQTTVPYTPTFRPPTASYTPTFRTFGPTPSETFRTTVTTTESPPPTATNTGITGTTATPTTTSSQPPTGTVTATTTQTLPATIIQTTQTTAPFYTPAFQTQATTPASVVPAVTTTANQTTATPTATPTEPLYRNGPVYRYMINSGDLTSSLTVTSNPSGALITLDGYNTETTPWTFTEISSGYHTLEITYPGYEAYIRNIYLDTGESLEVDADLVPLVATGTLFIDSTPQGANVYVDGNSQGVSPVTVNGLSVGPHQIELHLAGYEVLATTENVIEGQETDINLILTPYSPSSSYGSIDIASDIPGALVYLDGIYKGITLPGDSFNIIAVDPGAHTLLLHLPGYPDFTEGVQVDAGQVSYVSAVFSEPTGNPPVTPPPSPAVGGMVVTTVPAGGQVYVDNQFRGVAPVTIYNVPAGSHIVNIDLAGYTGWSSSIDLPPGQMIQVPATLVPGEGGSPVPTQAGLSSVPLLGAIAIGLGVVFLRGRRQL